MNFKGLILLTVFFCIWSGYTQSDQNFDKGVVFFNKFEVDSASFYFEKCKNTFAENSANHALLAKVHYYLGNIYKTKQNFQLALDNLNSAETIYKRIKDNEGLAKTYISIAEFYRSKHDFSSAENYLKSTRELIETYDISDQTLANYYNRQAALYSEKYKNHQKAIEYSEKVLAIAQKLNDKSLEASSLNEIAYAYENLNSPSAEIFYLKSLKIYEFLNDELYQSSILSNISRWYNKQGRILEMKPYLDKGYKICQDNSYHENKRVFSQLYAEYYEKSGNIQKALFYQKQYNTLEKTELIKKWNQQLIETERKYELDKKNDELEIQNLKLQNQSSELKNANNRFIIAVVVVSLLLFLILIIIYFLRRTKKNNKALKELSQQNEFLLREANHRINNNLQLIIILITDELKKSPDSESVLMKKLLTKIESIATLYRHLYQNKDKTQIEISNYIKDLFLNLDELLKANDIKKEISVENVSIKTDDTLLIGLLITELVINSVKHAFSTQKEKRITFELVKEDSQLVFTYTDNGSEACNTHIKPVLVDKLCRQLRVDYTIETTDGFSFMFQKK